MSSYPRTEEGFANAFAAAQRTAAMHPDKSYVLFVDSRDPTRYGVSLASLVSEDHVEPGTRANIVQADGTVLPAFTEVDKDPSP